MSPVRRLGLSVLVSGTGSAHIVAAGELDLETADDLAETIAEAGGSVRRVVLDLREVTFLDPVGVARVWAATRALRGRLAVVPPADGAALRLLQVLRLDDALPR